MDRDRFDFLARSIGTASRRTFVQVLLGAATFPFWLGPDEAAAKCVELGKVCKKRGETRRCCGGAKCRGKRCKCAAGKVACGDECVNLQNDPGNCGSCGFTCPSGTCRHGACTCDPFNNQCSMSSEGQCGCGAIVADEFEAACVDRNSACDLDRPCDSHQDCPDGSVCLRGCSDPPDPEPNRCSKPCVPL